ncbi:DUF2807 domain-containing protein [Luteimonas sp. Y-2-2-4F]|nr:DUF2807 domain-containing protein [Luteimonas sp. Y-2-2-4F]MCD9031988.1 DUF2807 domain-containing protein [Luteimonas sp. Y-2-2-4F]
MTGNHRRLPRLRAAALLALAAGLALPLAAVAQQRCRHTEPRQLQLDLAGVKTILFEIGSNKLRLDAAPGGDGALRGRACAAGAALLEGLTLAQRRDGDRLVVTLAEDRPWRLSLGESYSYLDIAGSVPDDVLVQLKVGSGDAWLTGGAAASADVGSGDVELRRVRGRVTAKVGSGDVTIEDAGPLEVLSVGSGDLAARRLAGPARVGSLGSGDLELQGVDGTVEIGSVGSGDASVSDVRGSVTVGSLGSGDLDVRNVRGDLRVRAKGSGDIQHDGVTGAVELPRRR